jgi:hypothetical protein
MANAKDILDRLGKARKVADELGLPLSTVTSWAQFNHIPDWRKPALLEIALKQGVDLSISDFPKAEERISRGQAA